MGTNEEILGNQGPFDSWADTAVKDSVSRRLRDDFRHAIIKNDESREIPNKAYAYFVPLVNPFFRTWRSRFARWVVSRIPEYWFGRGPSDAAARYVGIDALPYDFRTWEVDPMDFTNFSAAAVENAFEDEQALTTMSDVTAKKFVNFQALGSNRIRLPTHVQSNYVSSGIFSRD